MSHVDQTLLTAELGQRPARRLDVKAENRALVALAEEMAAGPEAVWVTAHRPDFLIRSNKVVPKWCVVMGGWARDWRFHARLCRLMVGS
ncbi:MAG TPA: hypothetical protein VGD78_09535 [Chthoniobacterales bacterium]